MFSRTTGRIDDRWQAFMKFQIARARQCFADAEAGVDHLDSDARWPVWSALILYRCARYKTPPGDPPDARWPALILCRCERFQNLPWRPTRCPVAPRAALRAGSHLKEPASRCEAFLCRLASTQGACRARWPGRQR